MSIDFKRKDYLYALPEWLMFDDMIEGERAMHAGRDKYLPMPSPDDQSEQNIRRYELYIQRATYYNYIGRTLEGLVGASLLRDPESNFEGFLQSVEGDISGEGVSIAQQARKALSQVLLKGRALLWVDYPKTDGRASVADMQSGRVRPVAHLIEAERVINWQTVKIGAEQRLGLVVFESLETEIKGYALEEVKKIYSLKLEEVDGRFSYVIEIYRQQAGKWVLEDIFVPTAANGAPLDFIPATFVGAENNDSEIDDSPLADIAYINLHHYQNSADYEESVHFTGQVQPYITGLSQDWVEENYSEGVVLGSKQVLVLPEGGSFGYAQAQPNALVADAMDRKRDAMIELGARIMIKGSANRVVADAESDRDREQSILSLAVSNVNSAYAKVAEWLVVFAGSGSALFELSTDFIYHKLSAQELTALVGAWQSGAIPQSELIRALKQANVIDAEKTIEDVIEELDDQDDGLGLELVDNE